MIQSRRDFSRIAQRFNAGPVPSGPQKSRRDERTAGQAEVSIVLAGLVLPFPVDPSVETLGYSQSSLRDAACETAGVIFRKALRLGRGARAPQSHFGFGLDTAESRRMLPTKADRQSILILPKRMEMIYELAAV